MAKDRLSGRAARARRSSRWTLALAAGAVVLVLVLALLAALAGGDDETGVVGQAQLERGQQLYAQSCASCHGASLEGQANAEALLAQGVRPAPPHDETGHSWHHADAYLFEVTKQGLPPGMPGFAASMSDEEIRAVLAYIKSTWPPEVRTMQPLQ